MKPHMRLLGGLIAPGDRASGGGAKRRETDFLNDSGDRAGNAAAPQVKLL